jgi:hypothetical protein
MKYSKNKGIWISVFLFFCILLGIFLLKQDRESNQFLDASQIYSPAKDTEDLDNNWLELWLKNNCTIDTSKGYQVRTVKIEKLPININLNPEDFVYDKENINCDRGMINLSYKNPNPISGEALFNGNSLIQISPFSLAYRYENLKDITYVDRETPAKFYTFLTYSGDGGFYNVWLELMAEKRIVLEEGKELYITVEKSLGKVGDDGSPLNKSKEQALEDLVDQRLSSNVISIESLNYLASILNAVSVK